MNKWFVRFKLPVFISLVLIMAMITSIVALASSVDASIVDVTVPANSVSLNPGQSAPIVINLSVTGKQEGTATFEVYRDWTLSGGTFTGSNAQEFTVPPRAQGADATIFTTSGTVSIAMGQQTGTFPLTVSVFDITNSNSTGAKLGAGHSGSYQVGVVQPLDTIAPVLTTPSNMTVEATGDSGAVVTFSASATDNIDGTVPVICSPASGSLFAIGKTTVNCSAKDKANNTATTSFDVTVQDTTAPAVTVPSLNSIAATSAAGAVVTFSASAVDSVDGALPPTCQPASGATFPIGSTTVVCSATDAHGNTGTASFTVNMVDQDAPVIAGIPADITAEATSPAGAAVTYTLPTATDAIDGPIPVSCTPASGSTFALGTSAVTCTAADGHNNTSTVQFNVTVTDTTAPSLALPAVPPVEATSAAGAAVTYSATATDLVDGAVTPVCAPASGATFPLGGTTVTCTAADSHDNAASGSFTVTVQDTTAPSVTVPDAQTVEATGPTGAVITFSASAVDLVDGAVAPVCAPASGSTFALGATTVTCSATDAHGNTGAATFQVTVQDTTAPTVTVPADITAEATGPSGALVTFTAAAADLVDGAVETTCTPASGATFPIAATSVTCTANDKHNNTGTAAFQVTVQDTTAPELNVSQNLTAEATGPNGAVVTFSASATDIVDGPVAVSCDYASGATFPITSTKVTCTAADRHGNTVSKSFTVTVQDTTAPVITGVPTAPIIAEATGPLGAVVTYTPPAATDTVDGVVVVTCTPASGSTFAIAVTTVNCTATDAHSNTATAAFTVVVKDTTAPILSLPANITVDASSQAGAVVSYTATASDLVDGAVAPTCTPASGSTFPLDKTTVTCLVQDSHGNQAAGVFSVSVKLALKGFYQPVDMPFYNGPVGPVVWNTVKGGSTVPLKFEIFAGSTELTSTSLIQGLPKQVICTSGMDDGVEATATGGTSLRYDTTAGQFIYNWQTPRQPGSCYQVTVTAQDGSSITAYFKLK